MALGQKTAHGDWDGALELLETQKATKQIDKDTAKRERAVLLTAKALDTFESDPVGSKPIAIEANKLAPDLIPAAIIAAKVLFQQADLRKGSKILEHVWKKRPHPEVAETYVHARLGDSVFDRLKRARHLASLYPHHAESNLAIAHAALAAGELKEAREAAETVLRTAPRESAYLLLADIEEAQTGDQGRVRQWLSRAVKAPRDPAWTADGYVSERWAPASPVTGKLNAFEWKVPVEQLGTVIDARDDFDSALAAKPVQSAPVREPAEPLIPAKSVVVSAEKPAARVVEADADIVDAEIVPAEPVVKPVAAKPEEPHAHERIASVLPSLAETAPAAVQHEEEKLVIPVPDDPGVLADDEEDRPNKKFRLF